MDTVFDARLQHPFCMIVSGPSMSGKTNFVTSLIEKALALIYPPPETITWFYGEETENINYLKRLFHGKINAVKGMPDSFDQYINPKLNNLIIIDDLMQESSDNPNVANLFTRQCHHKNTSVILVMQDLFYNGTRRKTLMRNAHYLVLFSSPLDRSSVYAVANKVMPKRSQIFLNIFEVATEKPNGYLFIDGRQTTPNDARLRTDIFKPYQRVFVPKP